MHTCWLWPCCREALPGWQSSCPAEFVPPFLGQKHVNHSHTALATNYAGLKDFNSTPGQCEEEHLWRQVQAQSTAWLLAFIESCSLPTHKSWDGDIRQTVLQGGLHQSVMSDLGVHLWSKLCLEKERLLRFLLWVCGPRHGVDTWLSWKTKPSSRSRAFCAHSLELLRLLMKAGMSWLHPRAQGEKGFLTTGQCRPSSPQELHKVRNTLV